MSGVLSVPDSLKLIPATTVFGGDGYDQVNDFFKHSKGISSEERTRLCPFLYVLFSIRQKPPFSLFSIMQKSTENQPPPPLRYSVHQTEMIQLLDKSWPCLVDVKKPVLLNDELSLIDYLQTIINSDSDVANTTLPSGKTLTAYLQKMKDSDRGSSSPWTSPPTSPRQEQSPDERVQQQFSLVRRSSSGSGPSSPSSSERKEEPKSERSSSSRKLHRVASKGILELLPAMKSKMSPPPLSPDGSQSPLEAIVDPSPSPDALIPPPRSTTPPLTPPASTPSLTPTLTPSLTPLVLAPTPTPSPDALTPPPPDASAPQAPPPQLAARLVASLQRFGRGGTPAS